MENLSIELRLWTKQDADEHTSLVNDGLIPDYLRPLFPKTKNMFLDMFDKIHSNNRIFYFAIILNGKIAGGISYEMKNKKIIELGYLWIAKNFRGLGIGLTVVLKLINMIFNLYPDYKITLQTISSNNNAIGMANKLDFQLRKDKQQKAIDNNGNPIVLLYYEKYNKPSKDKSIAA